MIPAAGWGQCNSFELIIERNNNAVHQGLFIYVCMCAVNERGND